ncbi:potassium-transporting ATPase subunit KdpA [Mucilaginibacter lappiensis]|uniref:Potassium-transporting ATPase potassium-binding subunit n=1 Tax=Mucilaginibacter lappiensis TaxID=354630 RepID=A0A841JBD4_9SPHI|nr:potassium-transporting ATPase subunit KdpA [Mucilaginibacter lappiensis]MBB6127954.1 K+-transporting ATPase ATPase A chain [Mucilaginibacter lappiensis]
MNTEISGVIFTYLLTLALAIPLGRHIARVFKGEKNWLDFMAPLERFIFRFSGIDTKKEMNWKQHLFALLTINSVWLIYAFVCLMAQGHLPLNPDANPGQSPDTAFNTAISFLVNCNLQHYSGESGATYFTQHFVFMFLHFVSAATGIAALIVVFRAMKDKITDKLGNFWDYFVKSITRILLPISFVIAVIFAFNGMTTSYAGKDTFISMQGDTVHVSRGPVAALVAIKHLGTNGGGWFGANSAHPIENPNYLTNTTELVAQCLIPIALVFALGFYLNKKKFSYVIFGVMTIGMLLFMIPTINAELNGNPAIAHMGVSQTTGAMEGKEVRFGPANSAYWSVMTTIISTGSVNSMHDSAMPMSGTMMLMGMMVNCFYGGCGVGILNFYIFIIIAVFISGLMVGRTPEFFGRKIEAREMKIASIIALLHPFIILVGAAISSYVIVHMPGADWAVKPSAWLNNPGNHGFAEMLYEYTSSAANNGSGFEGLGDGNIFWNVTTGIVMVLGRFLPIIGPLAIAGLLANKKFIPASAGTLKSDTSTFGIMIFAVIMIIAALSFFPALALGPIAEHFSLK